MTDDVDEETTPSRRSDPEEATVLGRRRREVAPPESAPQAEAGPTGLDDDTVLGSRRPHIEHLDDDTRVVVRDDELDSTRVVRRAPVDATRRSRRRQGVSGTPTDDSASAPVADSSPRRRTGAIDLPAFDPDDGSTFVARRESRRRAAAGETPVDDTVIVRGRAPSPGHSAPPADHRDRSVPPSIYQPRVIPAQGVDRSPLAAHRPQNPIDTAAIAAARRRGRRRLRITVIAASVGFVVIAAVLVALLATTWR